MKSKTKNHFLSIIFQIKQFEKSQNFEHQLQYQRLKIQKTKY